MNNRNSEKIKLLQILLLSIVIGFLTEYFLPSIIIGLLIYIIWLLSSLSNFSYWLHTNAPIKIIPVTDGVWSNFISYIIKLKKQISDNKKKHQKLIMRFNEILRSLPYPTIVINANKEIQWISKSAAALLNLNRKKDIGIRINNIIRNEKFSKKLTNNNSSEQKITINNSKLEIAISKLNKDTRILNIKDVSTDYLFNKNQENCIINVSHEIRTPLTIISGYLEVLTDDTTLPKNTQSMLKSAYLESIKMNAMFENLLQLSTIQNTKIDNIKPININNTIKDVCKNLLNIYPEYQNIKLVLDKTLQINTNYYHLYNLVLNLLENAIKYSVSDSIIKVICQLNKTHIELKIIDNGMGIVTEDLKQITNPFFRTKNVRASEIKGSGLGLAIVLQLVQKNNWILNIESKINKGSIFTITF